MTSFKYEPIGLAGPAFRLLRLLKGDDDPIQCQLFESKLPSPEYVRDYAALSYTWGGTSRPCNIVINGSNMMVTKNAYLALQDLRYKEKDRDLWVDALCIDQNNDREREQQVQQMGSIYSKAERVIIWLGESTYDTDCVMRHMKQLEKEGVKHGLNDQNISDKQWVNIWSALEQGLSADQRDLLVEGLRSLLCRRWFKRVWIIQETANARVAEIVCGSKSISASIFALMPSLLEITPDPHCQPILDIMPGALRNSSWWAKKRDLHTMLVKFCNSEATDTRDNIYALLGISLDACDTNLLKANYEKDLQDVIFDTALFLLNFNKLDSPIHRFFNWTLPKFLGNLNVLANEVLRCAMSTEHDALVKLLIVRDDVDVNIKDKNGQTPLLWAARNGRKAVAKLLLETGKVDIELKDTSCGQTPLLWAARNGHEAVVKLLLETGKVNIKSTDTAGYGHTPLLWAARNGHEAVVKLLLETGKVDIESKNTSRGQTPLLWAVRNGHEAVVKLLLEACEIDIELRRDYLGQTPLSLAAESGHEAVVKLLLKTGKVDIDSKDMDSRTPLSWAAGNGHKTVVKLLLETGKVDPGSKDTYGRTPLSWAAGNGCETVVKLLLETGKMDIDLKDKKGQTPLLWAVENGCWAVVLLLLDASKMDVRTLLSCAVKYKQEAVVLLLLETSKVDVQTLLSWAEQNRHEMVVKLMLETDRVGIESKDTNNRQVLLSWAKQNKHEAAVKLLLETSKVDVQTLLSWAAQNGHEAVVKPPLETGKVDPDSKDKYEKMPLLWAAQNGHERVVRLLLETGKVDPDLKDKYGKTPLLWAAENGCLAAVGWLLNTEKVDIHSKDYSGGTPLSWATQNGHEAVVELLQYVIAM